MSCCWIFVLPTVSQLHGREAYNGTKPLLLCICSALIVSLYMQASPGGIKFREYKKSTNVSYTLCTHQHSSTHRTRFRINHIIQQLLSSSATIQSAHEILSQTRQAPSWLQLELIDQTKYFVNYVKTDMLALICRHLSVHNRAAAYKRPDQTT